MNSSISTKLLSRSLIGALGLSALALLSVSEVAKAQAVPDIQLGADYFISPEPFSSFIFDSDKLNDQLDLNLPSGQQFAIPLKGKPIAGLPGDTDTVVERQEDCFFDNGQCLIPIEMTELSLVSVDPVAIPGVGQYDLFAELDPNTPTTGKMLIRDDMTFDSFLEVFYKVTFNPIGDSPDLPMFFDSFEQEDPNNMIPELADGALQQLDSPWSNIPPDNAVLVRGAEGDQMANCHTDSGACASNDFFPGFNGVSLEVVQHEKGQPGFPNFPLGHGTVITTVPVPEPSATLPVSLIGLTAIWGLRKKQLVR